MPRAAGGVDMDANLQRLPLISNNNLSTSQHIYSPVLDDEATVHLASLTPPVHASVTSMGKRLIDIVGALISRKS